MDARPSVTDALDAFGVSVTVTPPAQATISTVGAWLLPKDEAQPFGSDYSKLAARNVMLLSRAAVPSAPRGTVIVAPPLAGTVAVNWRVDGIADPLIDDELRVILVRT